MATYFFFFDFFDYHYHHSFLYFSLANRKVLVMNRIASESIKMTAITITPALFFIIIHFFFVRIHLILLMDQPILNRQTNLEKKNIEIKILL